MLLTVVQRREYCLCSKDFRMVHEASIGAACRHIIRLRQWKSMAGYSYNYLLKQGISYMPRYVGRYYYVFSPAVGCRFECSLSKL